MHMEFLWPGPKYSTRTKLPLMSLHGIPIGETDQVPSIIVSRISDTLKQLPRQELSLIHEAFKRAAHLFEYGVIDGESPQDYVRNAHVISGIPMGTLRAALKDLGQVMSSAEHYLKQVVPADIRIFHGCGTVDSGVYWIPKGKVLAVNAPGNNPMVHKAWIEALAVGYKILLRPSLKEPFTPYRLMKCMLQAGVSPEMLAFIPGDHSIVREMLENADLTLLFGGKSVIEQHRMNGRVITRGPGYSKVYWDGDAAYGMVQSVEVITHSVADDGGMKCTNASGILLENEKNGALDEIAHQLTKLSAGGLQDPEGRLPIFPLDTAAKMQDYMGQIMEQSDLAWTNRRPDELILDFGDGTAALLPLAFRVNRMNQALLDMELPFPCSWIYAPGEEEKQHIINNTLALTLITDSMELIRKAVAEPSVKKVVVGNRPPWKTYDFIPHDGFMTDHLFITKGVI